jgi:hypothetical protein
MTMSTITPTPAPLVFRSRFAPLRRLCLALVLSGVVFVLALVAIDRFRGERFPGFGEFLFLLLLPILAGLLTAALFAAMIAVFTVRVLPEGLRAYDTLARYRTVPWDAIGALQVKTMFGLPYLYISARGLSQPLTLPLWLDDLPRFIAAVEAQAGAPHPLPSALRAWRETETTPY